MSTAVSEKPATTTSRGSGALSVVARVSAIAEAVTSAADATPNRAIRPVTQCLLLDASTDRLVVTGTDMEMTVGRDLDVGDAQVTGTGRACVPAGRLRDILRNLSCDSINIEMDRTTLKITGPDCEFKIFGQEPEDFPPVGMPGQKVGNHEPVRANIEAATLRRLLAHTMFCAAREGGRYAFNSVLLAAGPKAIFAVASDGRRLSHSTAPGDGDLEKEVKALVPTKAARHLVRSLPEEGPVAVRFTPSSIAFQFAGGWISTNLIKGTFPPFEDILNGFGDAGEARIASADFLRAVRLASVQSDEIRKSVRVDFTGANPHGGFVRISSERPETGRPETGTGEVNCDVKGSDVPNHVVGLNHGFLTDAKDLINGSEDLLVASPAPNRPVRLRPAEESGGFADAYVIMPTNLSS